MAARQYVSTESLRSVRFSRMFKRITILNRFCSASFRKRWYCAWNSSRRGHDDTETQGGMYSWSGTSSLRVTRSLEMAIWCRPYPSLRRSSELAHPRL